MFKICGLPENTRDSAKRVNDTLKSLRSLQKSKISAVDGHQLKPKIVWKVESYVQGVLYRTVAIVEGACREWNNGNGLAAVILSRSAFETGAVFLEFRTQFNNALNDGDLDRIDALTMRHIFSDKSEKSESSLWEIEALPSVMTFIDKLDRYLASAPAENVKGKPKPARSMYNFLSEIVHPNYFGTLGLYAELDTSKALNVFDHKHALKPMVFAQILAGLVGADIVLTYANEIFDKLPDLAQAASSHSDYA